MRADQSVSRENILRRLRVSETGAELAALAGRHALTEHQADLLRSLAERLSADEHAPTAVREPGEVIRRHIADSLAGLELGQVREARRVADLGSGAGLPGLVLAVALPEAEVHLVESQTRKCAYMAGLVAALKLENAHVVCSRAEEWEQGMAANDLVVSRALAAQPVVLEYAAPLLTLRGWLVEWRGLRDEQEERASSAAAEMLGLRPVEVVAVAPFAGSEGRHLHVFEKVRDTPAGFPRRAGLAVRKPLAGAPQTSK